ncbi:MAG: polysialyltransferase family glycosyltransferase [Sulfurovum sp.]|nr:polysialyltransferase family glycosyltransferase [Sulfurovum sp.]
MRKCYLFVSFTNAQNSTILDMQHLLNNSIFVITNADYIPFKTDINYLCLKKVITLFDVVNELITRNSKNTLSDFVKKINSKYDEIEIIIPHFFNILSNHIINNSQAIFPNKQTTYSLYPDGLLSYTSYNQKAYSKGNIIRYLLAKNIGFNYKIFNGSISDPFKNIETIYSYVPELTEKYSADTIVKIPYATGTAKGNNILIVGHIEYSKLDKTKLEEVINTITEIITKSDTYGSIYYKPHPYFKDNADSIYNILSEKLPISYIKSKEPVENLFDSHEINKVISFYSTALVSLKMKYGISVDCYSINMSWFTSIKIATDLEKIFKKFNIKVYK